MDEPAGSEVRLVERLRAYGERPVEPEVARRVLTRATGSRSWFRSTKLKVAAAAAGGFLVGGVGLASAGTLPPPAQSVAHRALGAVGIDVPPGHDRYDGPECGGTYANHGQYVRSHKDDPNAGQSPCGKPVRSITGGTNGDASPDDLPATGGEERHGPPPGAPAHGKGKAKVKAKDTPKPHAEDGLDDEDASPEATPTTEAPATTTTTEGPTTTTTTEAPTTTSTSAP